MKTIILSSLMAMSLSAVGATNSFIYPGGAVSESSFDLYRYTITTPDTNLLEGPTRLISLIEIRPLTEKNPYKNDLNKPSFQLQFIWPQDSQIRTSYSELNWRYELTDLDSGWTIARGNEEKINFSDGGRSLFWLPATAAMQQARNIQLTLDIEFFGGWHLTPSMSPTCSSVLCMQPKQDQATFAGIQLAVPEPSQLALLVGGLTLTAMIARWKRRHL